MERQGIGSISCHPVGYPLQFLAAEFIILLKNVTQETEIIKLIIKTRNEIMNMKSLNDKPIDIGASIGFSMYPKDGVQLEDLVRVADKMMYKEKDSKRRV